MPIETWASTYTPKPSLSGYGNLMAHLAEVPDFDKQPEFYGAALGQSSTPGVFGHASQQAAFMRRLNNVAGLEPEAQDRWYASLTKAQQTQYRALGYQPRPEARGGILGAIGSGLSAIGGGIGKLTPDVIQDGAMQAVTGKYGLLNSLHRIGDLPQQGFRMGYAVFADGMDLDDAWNETFHGEGFHSKASIENATELLGGNEDLLKLARRTSAGKKPEEIMEEMGLDPFNPEDKTRFTQLMNQKGSPEFAEALNELDRGKVSMGRFFARNVMRLDHGSAAFNIFSGAVDGSVAVFLDPTMYAGKIVKTQRAAKFALSTGGDSLRLTGKAADDLTLLPGRIDEIMDVTSGAGKRRVHWWSPETVAEATNKGLSDWGMKLRDGDFRGLVKENREAAALFDNLASHRVAPNAKGVAGAETPWEPLQLHLDKVYKKALKEGDEEAAQLAVGRALGEEMKTLSIWEGLARGRAPGARRSQLELPYLTKAGIKRRRLQRAWTENRDFLIEVDPKFGLRVGEKLNKNIPLKPSEHAAYFWDDVTDAADLALLPHIPLPSNIDPEDIARLGIKTGEPLKKAQLEELIKDPKYAEHYQAYTGHGIGHERTFHEGSTMHNVLSSIAGIPGVKGIAKFTRTAGAKVPYDEISQRAGKQIRVYGPDSARQIADFVELGTMWGMSAAQRNAWTNAIIQSPQAGRRVMLTSYMDTMFTNLGLRETAEGKRFVDDFVKRMKQSYAATADVDDMARGNIKTTSALDPSRELAEFMAVPDLRALLAITKRQSFMKQMGAGLNGARHTAMMNKYVKPALVLRAAFLPRAAGDEWLSYVLRKPGMLTRSNLAKWSVADIQMDELVRFDDLGKEVSREARLTGQGLPPFLKAGYRTYNRIRDRQVFRSGGSGPLHSLSQDAALSRWSERKRQNLLRNQGRRKQGQEGEAYVYRLGEIVNPFKEETLRAAGVDPGSWHKSKGFFDYELMKNKAVNDVRDLYSYEVLKDTRWGNDLLDHFAESLLVKMTFGMQNFLRKGVGVSRNTGKLLSKTPVLRHFGTQVGQSYKFMAVHPQTQIATRGFFRNELHKSVYMQAVVNSKSTWQSFDNPNAMSVEDGTEARNTQQFIPVMSEIVGYDNTMWEFPQVLHNRQREVAESRFMRDALDHSYNYLDPVMAEKLNVLSLGLDADSVVDNPNETLNVIRDILNTDSSGELKAHLADLTIYPGKMSDELDDVVGDTLQQVERVAGAMKREGATDDQIDQIRWVAREWANMAHGARHADQVHSRETTDFMQWLTGNMFREDSFQITGVWEEARQGMDDILTRQFLDTENWDEVRKMERFDHLGDGTPLAHGLSDGENQFYTGQVSRRHLQPLLVEQNRRQVLAEAEEQLSPEGLGLLEDLLSDSNAPMWQMYTKEFELQGDVGDQLLPMPIASTDIEAVREVTSFLNKADTAEIAYLRDSSPSYKGIPRPPEKGPNAWDFGTERKIKEMRDARKGKSATTNAMADDLVLEEHIDWRRDAAAGFRRLSRSRGRTGVGQGANYSPDLHSLKNHVSLSSDTPVTQMGSHTLDDAGVRVTYPVFVEGATHEAAARDFAGRNLKYIEENFGYSAEAQQGLAHDALTPFLAERWDEGIGDFHHMAEVTTTQRSADRVTRATKGPLLEAVPEKGLWARAIETGFEEIGYGIDAMIRQPLYLGNYLEADAMAREFASHAITAPQFRSRTDHIFQGDWYKDRKLRPEDTRIDWNKLSLPDFNRMDDVLKRPHAEKLLGGEGGIKHVFEFDDFGDIVGLTPRFADPSEIRKLLNGLPPEERKILANALNLG